MTQPTTEGVRPEAEFAMAKQPAERHATLRREAPPPGRLHHSQSLPRSRSLEKPSLRREIQRYPRADRETYFLRPRQTGYGARESRHTPLLPEVHRQSARYNSNCPRESGRLLRAAWPPDSGIR